MKKNVNVIINLQKRIHKSIFLHFFVFCGSLQIIKLNTARVFSVNQKVCINCGYNSETCDFYVHAIISSYANVVPCSNEINPSFCTTKQQQYPMTAIRLNVTILDLNFVFDGRQRLRKNISLYYGL